MLGDSYLKAMSAFLSDFPPLSLGGPARLIISTGFLSFKGSNLCHFLKFTIVKLSKIGASFRRCPPSIFTERKRGGEATPTFFSAKICRQARKLKTCKLTSPSSQADLHTDWNPMLQQKWNTSIWFVVFDISRILLDWMLLTLLRSTLYYLYYLLIFIFWMGLDLSEQ